MATWTISELINHMSVIDNRHDHGIINDDDFRAQLRETATQLNDILWPKKEDTKSGFETKTKDEPKKEEGHHLFGRGGKK